MISGDYSHGPLAHTVDTELRRLRLVEETFDERTIAALEQLSLPANGSILEAGAGAGSIACWLADRYPRAHVLATDMDTRFLAGLSRPNLEVRQHDIGNDDFADESFGLIHARCLLTHVANRDQVVKKMAGWLVPGGWLFLEESCFFPADSSPFAAFGKTVKATEELLSTQGSNCRWSRKLPVVLARDTPLEEIGSTLTLELLGQGDAIDETWRLSLDQVGPFLLGSGLLTEHDLNQARREMSEPYFCDALLAMVSAWGRSPVIRCSRSAGIDAINSCSPTL